MLRFVFAGFVVLCCALPAGAVQLRPHAVDPQSGESCWVRFFGAPQFKQPLGRLSGGLYIQALDGPGLIGNLRLKDFFERAHSLVMGPEARLVAYAEPGFAAQILSLQSGREVADLRKLGFPARVASLKIVCE
jgi:hypothetical protein